MVGRAAGHNGNLGKILDFRLGQTDGGQVNLPVLHHGMDGILDGLGLLVDFLHHEMLKPGFFCGFSVPADLGQLLLDFIAVQVVEGDLALLEPGHFQVADVVDVPGVFQDGGHVGGQIGLSVLHAQNHGAVFPGHIDFLRVVLEHHRQGVGTPDADHGVVDGVHRGALIFFVVVIHQLDGHFRVRGGVEGVALADQFVLQLLVVFNDAVVHAHHVAVIGAVGVGIQLRRFPVGCPPGVTDAAGSFDGGAVVRFLRQHLQTAFGFYNFHRVGAIPDGQTGGVISPVFQFG